MITCQQVKSADDGVQTVDTITLDETARFRRRIRMTSDSGIEFLLDLPDAHPLAQGDLLLLSDGRVIEVRAASESLLEIRGKTPRHLISLAWHLGNRHQATEIVENSLRIRHDPIIATMLEGLGAEVIELQGTFHPEGGAYAEAQSQTHSHAHDHPAE